jgi:hypothetical protein
MVTPSPSGREEGGGMKDNKKILLYSYFLNQARNQMPAPLVRSLRKPWLS